MAQTNSTTAGSLYTAGQLGSPWAIMQDEATVFNLKWRPVSWEAPTHSAAVIFILATLNPKKSSESI